MRALVSTVACMPVVLEVAFLLALTTRIKISMSGQWLAGATSEAMLSDPSGSTPMVQRTKPPYMLRHALPEPTLHAGHCLVLNCGLGRWREERRWVHGEDERATDGVVPGDG